MGTMMRAARPRSFEELNSPERLAKLKRALSPLHTPKVIRNYVRNHYVVDLVDWLYHVAKGDEEFPVVDTKGLPVLGVDGQMMYAPAQAQVRSQCAKMVIEVATVGASVHHLGDDNESMQGAIALPELDLRHAQRRAHAALPSGRSISDMAAGKVESEKFTIPAPGFEHEQNGGNGHP